LVYKYRYIISGTPSSSLVLTQYKVHLLIPLEFVTVITRQTTKIVLSENINLTVIGTTKIYRSSKKSGLIQFA